MTFKIVASAVTCFTLSASIATASSPGPYPVGAEVAFVDGLQKDLMQRFPTVADALKAGYFRYTSEDTSGSISYANLRWQSADPQHPSQLWYDVFGNLLGADFSVLVSESKTAPALWGIQPGRWSLGRAHIDYVGEQDGSETYGLVSSTKFVAAGGNMANPDAATLVRLGVVSTAGDVKRIFPFPALWNLDVWVKPNPFGAFAYMNPLVTHRPDFSDEQCGP